MTGLQTYTGACLERGNKPGFNTGCSCSERMMFRHAAHFEIRARFESFLLYLCLRLPANGTNIDHTGNRTRWFDLLWTQALIHFNILTIFWPHTRDAAFGFPWPAHSWTFPWLWHTPSGNTHRIFYFLHLKCFIFCGQRYSDCIPGWTGLLVTFFHSTWSCIRRAFRIRNLHHVSPVFLDTSYRTHSLSSTTRGATRPKRPRIPPAKQWIIHGFPFVLSCMSTSVHAERRTECEANLGGQGESWQVVWGGVGGGGVSQLCSSKWLLVPSPTQMYTCFCTPNGKRKVRMCRKENEPFQLNYFFLHFGANLFYVSDFAPSCMALV